MKQKKYPKYKPSGVEWIGDVPTHWGVKRLRFLLTPDGVKIGPFGSALKYEYVKNTGIKIYGQEHVIKDDFTLGKKYIDHDKFAELKAYELSPGDIVVTMMGTTGRCKVFPEGVERGIMDSHLTRLRTKSDEYLPQLLALVVNDSNFVFGQLKWHSKGSIMEGLNSTIIKSLVIPVPSIEEQQQILKYITEKKDIIEEAIRKKEKLIELLQEERTAIINQAVTRGLDPNVKMKDSGVEWLGEIPEHWAVLPLKRIANPILGKMLTPEHKPGFVKLHYLRAQNIRWLKPDLADVKEMWFSQEESSKLQVQKDDLLVSEGGEVGRTCIWSNELEYICIQNSVHIVRVNRPFFSKYYLYHFYITGLSGHFDAVVNRISIAHLTGEKLREIKFIVPPPKEQEMIVKHIEARADRIERAINKLDEEIQLLYEYRTALINEVVTGKRCVI